MSKAAELANLIGNINAGGGGVNRNVIINGAMNVAQRGTSFTTVANGAYTIDQFRYGKSNDGEITITQDSSGPSGFANSLKVDVTTADASIAAGQYADIFARIEAQNLQLLKFGTSDAQNFTLSFYVKSNKTGTYAVTIGQHDNSFKQAILNYTINSADTWERKSLTFTGDTAGVIDDNADRGLEILWWLAAGSTYTGGSATGAFATYADANHAAGQAVNLLDSTSNEWFLTGVQLEIGQNPTEFEHEPIERTLAKCKRYYQKLSDSYELHGQICTGHYSSSQQFQGVIKFVPQMRAAPSLSHTTTSSNNTSSAYYVARDGANDYIDSLAFYNANAATVLIYSTAGGSATQGVGANLSVQSTITEIAAVAEL